MSLEQETTAIKLARIEEKLDALEKRLVERCAISGERLRGIEKSIVSFGERIGKIEAEIKQLKEAEYGERISRLEAESQQAKGSKAAFMTMLAGAGAAGALILKVVEALWKAGNL